MSKSLDISNINDQAQIRWIEAFVEAFPRETVAVSVDGESWGAARYIVLDNCREGEARRRHGFLVSADWQRLDPAAEAVFWERFLAKSEELSKEEFLEWQKGSRGD